MCLQAVDKVVRWGELESEEEESEEEEEEEEEEVSPTLQFDVHVGGVRVGCACQRCIVVVWCAVIDLVWVQAGDPRFICCLATNAAGGRGEG